VRFHKSGGGCSSTLDAGFTIPKGVSLKMSYTTTFKSPGKYQRNQLKFACDLRRTE
jgi:hypothetical protein